MCVPSEGQEKEEERNITVQRRDVRNVANKEVIDQEVLRIRAFNSLRFTDVPESS